MWLDFGSLLGWCREHDVLLGGDLDLGAMWCQETLREAQEAAKRSGVGTLERRVGGKVQALKILTEVPIDLHFYRAAGGEQCYTATGYVPEGFPRAARRGIHDVRRYIRGCGRRIEQGGWPYVPVVWRAPARFLGAGKRDKVFTMPRDPLGLVEAHYGSAWRRPNGGTWAWQTDHWSSCCGLQAKALLRRIVPQRTFAGAWVLTLRVKSGVLSIGI